MARWPTAGNIYPVTPKAYPVAPKVYPGANRASFPSGAVQVMVAGDSISRGANSTDQGGWRQELSWYIYLNGLGIDLVGSKMPIGTMPDNEHCCVSGATSAQIVTNVTNDLLLYRSVKMLIVMMGTNNLRNAGQSGPVAAADIAGRWTTLQAALEAIQPTARMVVSTVLAIASPAPGFDQWADCNTALQTPTTGYIDVFNAAHPSNQLFVVDSAVACGANPGANFDDELHPNSVGHHTALAIVYLSTAIRTHLRSIAPTLNALACTITIPTAGTTVTVGVPVIVTVTITRSPWDCTVAVKDTALSVLGAGSNTDKNVASYTYSWTPLVGDVGSFTLNATVTDTISSATANAAGVTVTVETAADYSDIETLYSNVLHDWWAETGTVEVVGVSAWTANVSGHVLVQAVTTAQPLLTAVDATLNNKKSIAGDSVDDTLVSATLNFAAPATQNLCFVGVAKQRTWTSGDYLFSSGTTTLRFYQVGSSPQLFIYNATLSPANAAATLGTWFRFRALFTGATSGTADYLRVGATTVTGFCGNNDPGANFAVFSRAGTSGWIDGDIARLTVLAGEPPAGEHDIYDGAMSAFYNNVPAI